MILVPAGVLTVMSVRTLVDEDRNALIDLQTRVPTVQARFTGILDAIEADVATGSERENPHVLFPVAIDRDGDFVEPRLVQFARKQPSDGYAQAIAEGRRLEFERRDPLAAAEVYEARLAASDRVEERAALRNLLGRTYREMRDADRMLAVHADLRAASDLFAPDGGHPLSMSVLRLVAHLEPAAARPILEAWVERVEAGHIPMFPGFDEYVRYARSTAERRGVMTNLLRQRLERLEDRLSLLENASSLHPSGTRNRWRFLSGSAGGHQLVMRRGRRGVSVDVDRVARSLAETLPEFYGLELFDLESAAEVESRMARRVHIVAPLSEDVFRLNVVLYARDPGAVFGALRQKRVQAVAGILGLAALIAFGAVHIYRSTTREMAFARMRSDFVANVSHELRTPLQSIRLHAETLSMKRYRDEAQLKRYLETITREAARLSRMVGNVLDFSRIESGRKTYAFETAEVAAIVRQTVDELRPGIEEAGLTLDAVYEGDTTARVDAEAVDNAVANLVGNAVKYSGQGIEIGVAVTGGDGVVTVEVADRGIGVPPDEREAIFEKFRRASNAADATGTGLGLALVKDVAVAHGGSVEVTDRDGGGSVFRLTLPKGRAS